MKALGKLNSVVVIQLLACLLVTRSFGVDHFIGVNFTGAGANGAPTSLDPRDAAGVVPQTNWNNFSAYSAGKGILSDGTGNLTGITISYLTGEMFGSGTYNAGLGFTNGNDKMLNGYLNSTDPSGPLGTNVVTFTNLSPANAYTIITYTLRDVAGSQAAYWINDNYAQAIVILSEDRFFWQADPVFRRGTNTVRPASELANYVRWDGVAPRANGTISVNVASELDAPASFYRGPINGIQLISTNAWPSNSTPAAISLQPANQRVPQGQSGTFQVVVNGPWQLQWHSNNFPIIGATSASFTTVPLVDFAGTTNRYYVVVSNNVNSVTSSIVNLVLLPPLPPGGIFHDPFDYPPGPLLNKGDYTVQNTALVHSNGLSYTDADGLALEVSGNSMRPQIDWDPFSNMPIKLFGTNVYGGLNSTSYVSFLFDFTCLSTNNSGYVGVSGFLNTNVPPNWDWPNEQFFIGKRWYNDFLGYEGGGGGDSTIPYRTNGFIVVRIANDGATTTADLYHNPPLSGLPAVPDLTVNPSSERSFNAVAVNAGEWDGPVGAHRNDFTPPGPLVDEFRFGTTYASVAPSARPKLSIQLVGSNVQISWPTSATGYGLQQSDSLSSPNWSAGPAGNPVTIPASQTARYYRLSK